MVHNTLEVINIISNWKDGSWFFSISNPITKKIVVEKERIRSTKDDSRHHGIGIKNVNEVIAKYGGEYHIECNDGVFKYMFII